MKILEFDTGFINLKNVTCMELIIDRPKPHLFSTFLYADSKSISLFSFEDEEDAKEFVRIFYEKLSMFICSEWTSICVLKTLIREALAETTKESLAC